MDDACDLLCLDASDARALREALAGTAALERGAGRARALADPTRLAIAVLLREGGELCGCDVAWITGRAQTLVSHHLRALRAEALVSSRRVGKMVLYDLTDAGRDLLDAVLAAERRA